MMHENENKKKNGKLVWSEELHNKFVDAVNQLGIEKALPKKILPLMNDEKLTYSQVASHLQKYKLRLKRASNSLPYSASKQYGQSNNTNNEDKKSGIGVFSTNSPSNEQYKYCNDASLDASYHSYLIDAFDLEGCILTNSAFNNLPEDLVNASPCCNCCSQVLAEIAKLRQDMADENHKIIEIIHGVMARQDMLMHIVLQVHQPSRISPI